MGTGDLVDNLLPEDRDRYWVQHLVGYRWTQLASFQIYGLIDPLGQSMIAKVVSWDGWRAYATVDGPLARIARGLPGQHCHHTLGGALSSVLDWVDIAEGFSSLDG